MRTLKKFLRDIPFLGPRIRWAYLLMNGKWKSDIPYWIGRTIGSGSAFVVQIGSNDGSSGDPLNRLFRKNKRWRGLLVEPVPYLFEKLKKRYPDRSRFTLENVAINNGEKLPFYWVDQDAKKQFPDLPGWFEQLGSFNRQHIVDHLSGKVEAFIRSTEIQGMSLSALFKKNSITRIDVLHIDTEGYDWEILSQLKLDHVVPEIILFEHKHLDENKNRLAFDFLKEHYLLFTFTMDTLCISKANNRLTTRQLAVLDEFAKR